MEMTVLVVNNSVTMVLSLKTRLAMHGFAAETASHRQEALDKMNAGLRPELIRRKPSS
jgi:two-component system, chemotaxis family, chemotaxis protein CheY